MMMVKLLHSQKLLYLTWLASLNQNGHVLKKIAMTVSGIEVPLIVRNHPGIMQYICTGERQTSHMRTVISMACG